MVASKKSPSTIQNGTSQTEEKKSGGFFGFGGKTNTSGKNSVVSIKSTPKYGISNIALDWLDKQKNADGIYYFGLNCTDKNNCAKPREDSSAGIAVIWGRYKAYSKSKDPKELQTLLKDISTYSNKDKIGFFQMNSWNCKFMYDLWNDPVFNSSQKNQIKQICYLAEYYPLPELQNDTDLNQLSISNIDNLINQITSSPQLTLVTTPPPLTTSLFREYSIAASDYAIRYQWDKKDSDLKIAQLYFQKALEEYINQKNSLQDKSPLIGIAALDLFSITKNTKYQSLAYYISKQNSTSLCVPLEHCMNFAILSNQIYQLVKDNKYNVYRLSTVTGMIDKNLDNSSYKGNKFNRGAFYIGSSNLIYPVRENGIIIGLLAQ
jgi:hypothetical protein